MVISCTNDSSRIDNNIVNNGILADDENIVTCASSEDLPARDGSPPETTTDIPHMQLGGFEQIPQVIEELFRRVYSIPGIENRESAILGWRALWLTEEVNIVVPEALIRDREFGHIHDDASLHIFLEPTRSNQAVSACWGIFHPFAVQNLPEWNGFVMLYTPQSIEELNVTFQLIVEAFNYVTGQNLVATDYY